MQETFEQVFEKRNNRARQVMIAGYPCLVKRVPIQAYIANGIIPQELAEELQTTLTEFGTGDELGEISAEQKAALLKFRQTVIELGVVHPRLSFELVAPLGKVSVYDLADTEQFLNEAYAAVMNGPIQTVEGEASADALRSFRDNGDGANEPAGTGTHGADVRPNTGATAGSA